MESLRKDQTPTSKIPAQCTDFWIHLQQENEMQDCVARGSSAVSIARADC